MIERSHEIFRLIDECPIGHDGRGNLVRHRATTDADVIAWVNRLHEIRARLREHPARANASAVLYGSANKTAGES